MTEYEKLLDDANKEDVIVIESYNFTSDRLKGLYCDGSIALNKELKTEPEKKCVLAEELGHHYTTSGNIIDIKNTENRKQEHRARVWAYRKALSLSDLVSAYKRGCKNRYEIAEYLNVTESFLSDAIEHYKSEYGLCTKIDNYIIYFEPLGVLELNV